MTERDDSLIYFLVVFDHAAGERKCLEQFHDVDEALKAYEVTEQQYRSRDRVDIVLIGSDSLETIHYTHSVYFPEVTRESHSRYARFMTFR